MPNFANPDGVIISDNGAATVPFAVWISRITSIANSVQSSGTTAQRPTTGLWIGRFYFDTTLGIPIWVQSVGPVVWVDATGTPV